MCLCGADILSSSLRFYHSGLWLSVCVAFRGYFHQLRWRTNENTFPLYIVYLAARIFYYVVWSLTLFPRISTVPHQFKGTSRNDWNNSMFSMYFERVLSVGSFYLYKRAFRRLLQRCWRRQRWRQQQQQRQQEKSTGLWTKYLNLELIQF